MNVVCANWNQSFLVLIEAIIILMMFLKTYGLYVELHVMLFHVEIQFHQIMTKSIEEGEEINEENNKFTKKCLEVSLKQM